MDIGHIKEIKPFSELKNTYVPNSGAWLKGLVNLRGNLVPVIDLGIIFNIRDKADKGHNVMILSVKGRIIGILVDAIGTIMDIGEDELEKPPTTLSKDETKYIAGVKRLENALLVHLAPEHLITMEESSQSYREKRRHTRKTVNLLAMYTVSYNGADYQWLPCVVLDMSPGGLRIKLNEHLNIGTTVRLNIKDDLEIEGTVVSSRNEEDKSSEHAGIKFNDLQEVIEGKIIKLLRDK
ncbi:MAG: chemotaxis protein CheW [Nitrospirae bacterium]|nr:chemotaxis protein CheW [Nitrospirota bacterium]